MTTSLPQEVDRWQDELDRIADSSATDGWQLQERRLAETQHTISSYRAHILPLLTGDHPYDVILADEISRVIDQLEELRIDLYGGDSAATHQEIAELLAALRSLARLAARFDADLQTR